MSESRQPGYIAVSRAIFDHPFFKSNRPFSRLEAWEWLINAASWKPKGLRNKFGVIHTERGQLATTRRALAAAWRWPKTNVDRFLKRLAADSMILVGDALTGPKNRPENEPIIGYPQTMITVCNYDKFQRQPVRRAVQQPGQKAGQNLPYIPGIVNESGTKPANHRTIDSKGGLSADRNRIKPPHGAKGRGMVWADHGTTEWQTYAQDYKDARGVDKLPESRIGGRGNWFRWLGERKAS